MLLLLSVGNVLTGGSQLSAQEQSKRFSVKVDNITLKEAIEVIKKQGNYSFLIRNNDIDLNRKVSVNINNGTINDVMGPSNHDKRRLPANQHSGCNGLHCSISWLLSGLS